MKKKLFLVFGAAIIILSAKAQGHRTEVKDAQDRFASVEISYNGIPEGTEIKNGTIKIKKGYTAGFADNRQAVVIKKINTGAITGAFACSNNSGQDKCRIGIFKGSIICNSKNESNHCSLAVAIDPRNFAITKLGSNWKTVNIDSVYAIQPRTEDPDQGGEVKEKNINRSNTPIKQ